MNITENSRDKAGHESLQRLLHSAGSGPTARLDWGRLAYYVVKFFWLSVLLAVVGFGLFYAWVLLGVVCDWVTAAARWVWSLPLKRAFYSVCVMALFFYAAVAMRWLAKLLKAKATQISRSSTQGGEGK